MITFETKFYDIVQFDPQNLTVTLNWYEQIRVEKLKLPSHIIYRFEDKFNNLYQIAHHDGKYTLEVLDWHVIGVENGIRN